MVVLRQINNQRNKNTAYTHNVRGVYRLKVVQTLEWMSHAFYLFWIIIIVLNLLDEGRRTYSLYRMYVLSLIILLVLRSTWFSYKAVTEDCLKPVILLLIFTTRCNLFLSFWLTFPKPTYKRKCQNTLDTRFVKHG